MTENCDWLPALVSSKDYGDDWKQYVNELFAIFYRDFIESQPKLDGKWVCCRRDPIYDGKEAGFWHCVSEGPEESKRTLDLRRCERIAWIRRIIDNAQDQRIVSWSRRKGREQRRYL